MEIIDTKYKLSLNQGLLLLLSEKKKKLTQWMDVTYSYEKSSTLIPLCPQMVFNDELLQHPGMYRLLYYSGKYSSYLGMSDPFPVLTRQD